MNPKLHAQFWLKFHPFRPDIPVEALYITSAVDAFLRRVELGIADGGYVMVTGDPGTGKNVALRLLARRLEVLPDVIVGTIEHPQSRTSDFYQELADLFAVQLHTHDRWGGFKALRSRWTDHITTTLTRPVLILDEAQEALSPVFTELRMLASKDLDTRQLLCVVLAGDVRLVVRLRTPDLMPLGSRIRRRLVLDYLSSPIRNCVNGRFGSPDPTFWTQSQACSEFRTSCVSCFVWRSCECLAFSSSWSWRICTEMRLS